MLGVWENCLYNLYKCLHIPRVIRRNTVLQIWVCSLLMMGTGLGCKGMKYKNFSQSKTRVRILGVAVIVVKQWKKWYLCTIELHYVRSETNFLFAWRYEQLLYYNFLQYDFNERFCIIHFLVQTDKELKLK